MTPQERYKRYIAAHEALEDELAGIDAALERMKKPAAHTEFQVDELLEKIARARRAMLPLRSHVNRGRYAKVSFR